MRLDWLGVDIESLVCYDLQKLGLREFDWHSELYENI